MPIPHESVGLNPGSAPPLMLPQQQMDVSELRELVSKLSDNQASMMDFLQSLIESHPGRNLDFSQNYKQFFNYTMLLFVMFFLLISL